MNNECCNGDCNQGRDCPLRKIWTSCVACGQRVTGDSIHTCSPQLKKLTDEEIMVLYEEYIETQYASESNVLGFGRAILRKAQEK